MLYYTCYIDSCSSLTLDPSVKWSWPVFPFSSVFCNSLRKWLFSLWYFCPFVHVFIAWIQSSCSQFGITILYLWFMLKHWHSFIFLPLYTCCYVYLNSLYFTCVFLTESNTDRCTYKYWLNWKNSLKIHDIERKFHRSDIIRTEVNLKMNNSFIQQKFIKILFWYG